MTKPIWDMDDDLCIVRSWCVNNYQQLNQDNTELI